MAAVPVQISITDPTTGLLDVSLDDACTKLTIKDTTDFSLPDGDAYEQSEFLVYRELKFTKPDDTTYTYNSMYPTIGDAYIAPVGIGGASLTMEHTIGELADGVWKFCYISLPSWHTGLTYEYFVGSVVQYTTKMYKCIQNCTGDDGTPDSIPSFWEEIGELGTPLGDEYTYNRVCGTVLITCTEILPCYEERVKDAICKVGGDLCHDESLCNNKPFLDSMKIRILLDGAKQEASVSNWEDVKKIVGLLKNICNCK